MTGVSWQRWALGLVVASVIPITIGGAGCAGKDESPGAAGTPSTSGTAAGGSAGTSSAGSGTAGTATAGTATAGSATAGAATGGSASGGTAAGGSASAGGPSTDGGASFTCCAFGDTPACSADGHQLKSCYSVVTTACTHLASIYAYVWQTQECAQGCEPSRNGGASGSGTVAHCK